MLLLRLRLSSFLSRRQYHRFLRSRSSCGFASRCIALSLRCCWRMGFFRGSLRWSGTWYRVIVHSLLNSLAKDYLKQYVYEAHMIWEYQYWQNGIWSISNAEITWVNGCLKRSLLATSRWKLAAADTATLVWTTWGRSHKTLNNTTTKKFNLMLSIYSFVIWSSCKSTSEDHTWLDSPVIKYGPLSGYAHSLPSIHQTTTRDSLSHMGVHDQVRIRTY